jgi:hypothetical protein
MVLIVSIWAGLLLFSVGQVRKELELSNELLGRILAYESGQEQTLELADSDEIESEDSESHWCPRCKQYYPITTKNSKCTRCGLVGHPG